MVSPGLRGRLKIIVVFIFRHNYSTHEIVRLSPVSVLSKVVKHPAQTVRSFRRSFLKQYGTKVCRYNWHSAEMTYTVSGGALNSTQTKPKLVS